MASEKIQGFLEAIGALSVAELNELIEALRAIWELQPGAHVNQTPNLQPVEFVSIDDFDPYDVVIKDAGPKRLQVLKVMRELIPSLGLKDAKTIVDNTPSTLVQTESTWEAGEIKKRLVAVGAIVEIKEVIL